MYQETARVSRKFITQDRLRKAESNRLMHQENKRVTRKFVQYNFRLSGCGRAHAIVITASHACSRETRV